MAFFTRCRNFDDDGVPIRGGCQQKDCRFAHPDHASWRTAHRYKPGGSNSWQTKGHRENSGHWKSTSDDSSALTSTNTSQLPETGSRWGKPSTPGAKPAFGSKSSMSNEGDRFKPHEWKPTPEIVGWVPPSNDWGSSSEWGQGGWGQGSGSGWPTESVEVPKAGNDSGWGQASGSGWPTSTEASQSSNVSSKGEISGSTQTLEPPRRGQTTGTTQTTTATSTQETNVPRKAPPLPGRSEPSSSKKPHLKPLNTDVPAAQPSTPSTATLLPSSSLKTPTTAKIKEKKSFPIEDSQTGANRPSSSNQGANLRVKPFPEKYVGPNGRGVLFSDTLSQMQDAIIAQIIYQRVDRENARWKTNQISEIYSHATPRARQILDGNRNEFTRKVTEAKRKRDIALTDLIHLPEIDTKRPVINTAETMEQVVKYTKELQQWFIEARIDERLPLAKKPDTKPSPGPTQAEGQTTAPLTAAALLERGNWSWAELSDAIKVLDAKFESASEQLYSKKYMNYDPEIYQDNLRKTVSLDSVARSRSASPEPEIPLQKAQALKQAAELAGKKLYAQAEHAAKLYEKLGQMDDEYNLVTTEKEQINALCDQAESQFIGFEREKVALEAEIKDLVDQLQNLHLHKRPSPEAPSINYDDVVYQLIPRFQQTLEVDLQSIFGPLQKRAEECQDNLKGQIDDLLNPIHRKTEEIRRVAQGHPR